MQSKKSVKKIAILVLVPFFVIIMIFLYLSYWYMVKCEGEWYGKPLEKQKSIDLREIKRNLESDIAYIQGLGLRNSVNDTNYKQLRKCEEWIIQKWESMGYEVKRDIFSLEGREYSNLVIELKGQTAPADIVIVSAQYDTLPDSPGANNNGSGMAILFELSRLLKNHIPDRTLRLIQFVNEEDPFFGTDKMGSYKYAKRSYELKENIIVMLSLDAMGYYTDESGSQRLPFPFSMFYPDRGNFLAFIGNLPSRAYVKKVTASFKKGSSFPIEAGVAPEWVDGVTWSDHSSFWKFGYLGMQITDAGGFRSPYHTTKEDTMEKLDFDVMSRIVVGMYTAIVDLTKIDR